MSRPLNAVFAIGGMYGGGSERQIVTLLKHLNRDRVQPRLYMAQATGPLMSEIPGDVPVASFDQRYQGPHFPRLLSYRRRVRDMLRYFRQNPVDVCYDRTFLMTLVAAAAAQRAGVPNISTIVTDPTRGFYPVAGRFSAYKRHLLGHLYRKSALVLANSQGSARHAEMFYGLPDDSVVICKNALDFSELDARATASIADPWWCSPSTQPIFRIVSAGRLNHEKGFHLLIEAIHALLPDCGDVRIKVAVLGEGEDRQKLQSRIAACQLEDTIRLVGYRSESAAWYRSADLYVLPSLLEGMPNVLLEAMGLGTAVVAADCPSGPREALRDGTLGRLCVAGDAVALADAIMESLHQPHETAQMAEQARQFVREQFDVASVVRSLEDHLFSVAGGREVRGSI